MRSVLLTGSIILAVTTTCADAAVLDVGEAITSAGASPDGGMLTININGATGKLSILNTSGAALIFEAYSMLSTAPGGNLYPGANVANVNTQAPFVGNGLNSIQQQAEADSATVISNLGPRAPEFEVVSATTREIAEIGGIAVLQPGASWSPGRPLRPGTNNNANNFAFMYAWDNPNGGLEVLYSEIVTNTPEPASMGLVLFMVTGLIARKRRRA